MIDRAAIREIIRLIEEEIRDNWDRVLHPRRSPPRSIDHKQHQDDSIPERAYKTNTIGAGPIKQGNSPGQGPLTKSHMAYDPVDAGQLNNHKGSNDHDGRYHTKGESDGRYYTKGETYKREGEPGPDNEKTQSLATLNERFANKSNTGHDHDARYPKKSHTHSADDVTSGTFGLGRLSDSIKSAPQGDESLRRIAGSGQNRTVAASDHIHSISFKALPPEVRQALLGVREQVRRNMGRGRYKGEDEHMASLVLALCALAFDDPDETAEEATARCESDPEAADAHVEHHVPGYVARREEGTLPRFYREAHPDMVPPGPLEDAGNEALGEGGGGGGREPGGAGEHRVGGGIAWT